MDFTGATAMERVSDGGRHHFKTMFDRTPIEAAEEVLAAALTISVGTPAVIIPDVGAAFNQGTLNDIVASLGTQINNLRSSLLNRNDMLPLLNLSGTNIANSTTARYAKGGILMTSHTVQNSQVLIGPAAGRALATGYSTTRRPYYSLLIDTQASVAELRIKAGLTLTSTMDLATDDNQAFFWFDTATNANLHVGVSIGGTDVLRDTGIALPASSLILLEIEVDENRIPRFYITIAGAARREVGRLTTGTGFFNALTAGINLLPWQGFQTLANPGAKSLAFLAASCGLYAAV